MAHTLTLDDIFAIERVTDAQISPDGSHVAFVVTREFTEGEHSISESGVWIVSFDGNDAGAPVHGEPPRRQEPTLES